MAGARKSTKGGTSGEKKGQLQSDWQTELTLEFIGRESYLATANPRKSTKRTTVRMGQEQAQSRVSGGLIMSERATQSSLILRQRNLIQYRQLPRHYP